MQAKRPLQLPADSFRISLHIRHPSVDPAEISRELRFEADESFRAGEPRKAQRPLTYLPGQQESGRRGSKSVYAESYWVATLDSRFWSFGMRATPATSDVSTEFALAAASSADVKTVTGRSPDWLSRIAARTTLPPPDAEISLEGAWLAQMTAVNRRIGAVLALITTRLALRHMAFLERLRAEGGEVRLAITLTPEELSGFSLMPAVSHRLAQLGIQVDFEFDAD